MTNEMIENILKERYMHEGESSWEDVCRRVCKTFADDDKEFEEFYEMMYDCRFAPNTPAIANAGKVGGTYSACFVTYPKDSLEDILETAKGDGLVFKAGGGMGHSWDEVRAKNEIISTNGGRSSGVLSWLKIINAVAESVKNGGIRRAALLNALSIEHPDALDFIRAKEIEGELSNMNLSLLLTEKFMDDVKTGNWNNVVSESIDFKNGEYVKVPHTVGELWREFIEHSWKSGEPAALFDRNINDLPENKLLKLGRIRATNPCGELIMYHGGSCVLGSLNLYKYFKDGDIDEELLARDTRVATRFLNRVLMKNRYPLKVIEEETMRTRRIGLGFMGYHTLLIKMRIPYGSEKALNVLRRVLSIMKENAEEESHQIALGPQGSFPSINLTTWDRPMANASLMTCAPTGTGSILLSRQGVSISSGIEPYFALVMMRRNVAGKEYFVVNELFDADLKKMCDGDENLYNDIINEIFHTGTLQGIECIPDKVKEVYACALDIPWEKHVITQAVAQKYIDASISKTCNLPEDATVEDVGKAYLMAYDLGIKGLTVYRNNSRTNAVLTNGKSNNAHDFTEFVKDGEVYVKCPECGHEFKHDHMGCITCENCGFSRCQN